MMRQRQHTEHKPRVASTLTLATIVLLNGTHLPAEFVLRKLALFGRASTGVCVEG